MEVLLETDNYRVVQDSIKVIVYRSGKEGWQYMATFDTLDEFISSGLITPNRW